MLPSRDNRDDGMRDSGIRRRRRKGLALDVPAEREGPPCHVLQLVGLLPDCCLPIGVDRLAQDGGSAGPQVGAGRPPPACGIRRGPCSQGVGVRVARRRACGVGRDASRSGGREEEPRAASAAAPPGAVWPCVGVGRLAAHGEGQHPGLPGGGGAPGPRRCGCLCCIRAGHVAAATRVAFVSAAGVCGHLLEVLADVLHAWTSSGFELHAGLHARPDNLELRSVAGPWQLRHAARLDHPDKLLPGLGLDWDDPSDHEEGQAAEGKDVGLRLWQPPLVDQQLGGHPQGCAAEGLGVPREDPR
mmetsp:Transcript_84570/g.266971  ORF Transcript_84570/g.266971 Transcript_84570/m.266971 type:complete len:301 (+) Transcript_84570:150-1052(+)